MHVLGLGDRFVFRETASHAKPVHLPKEFIMPTPFDGPSAPMPSPSAFDDAGPHGHGDGSSDSDVAPADRDHQFEDDMFVPVEDAEDLVAEVIGELGGDSFMREDPTHGSGGCGGDDPQLPDDTMGHSYIEGSGKEHAVEEPPPPLPFAPPTLAQLVEASRVSSLGYVSCSLEPWKSIISLGRRTTWPVSKPEEARSVSMRCYVHPGCKVISSRRAASDSLLLSWLYSGTIVAEGATAMRKQELRAEHEAVFKRLIADPIP